MSDLEGKRVAVLVESEYIPEEIGAYRRLFPQQGVTVELLSRLWGQPEQIFVSDVLQPGEGLRVTTDICSVEVEDYDAVIMAANYTSVRLRQFDPPADGRGSPAEWVRTAPAVDFFAHAMAVRHIIKGALCHGLWILTPRPDLLRGRRVTCHRVVLADVLNAGGVYDPSPVVVDDDLVTGDSKDQVEAFIGAVCRQMLSVAIPSRR